MRKESFKNADYPNIKAGNSSLHNTPRSESDKLLMQGWKWIRWQVGKPFTFQNQKAFQDPSTGYWDVYERS